MKYRTCGKNGPEVFAVDSYRLKSNFKFISDLNISFSINKKTIIRILTVVMVLALGTTTLQAQDLQPQEVPQAVMQSFEKENFDARDIEWERTAKNYKVEFEEGRLERDIWYDKNGQMLRMEKELTKQELPLTIKETLESQYSDFSFDSAELIDEKGKVNYEVEVETLSKEKIILFDESGKVLSEQEDD